MIILSWEALTFPSLSENRNDHSYPFLRMYSIHKKNTSIPLQGTNVFIIRGSTQIPDKRYVYRLGAVTQHRRHWILQFPNAAPRR